MRQVTRSVLFTVVLANLSGAVTEACSSPSAVPGDAGAPGTDGGGVDGTFVDALPPGDGNADVMEASAADASDGAVSDAPIADPCATGGGVQPGAPWPMFGRCAARPGRVTVLAAQTSAVKWQWDSQLTYPFSSGAVAADGTIYVTNQNAGLYALTSKGTLRWSAPSSNTSPMPAIGADGTVYVKSSNALTAVNPDSTQKWTLALPGFAVASAPAIAADGTIYVASYPSGFLSAHLLAVTPAGTIAWDLVTAPAHDAGPLPTPNVVGTSPAVAADGTVYVSSIGMTDAGTAYEGLLLAVESTGTVAWTVGLPSCEPNWPVIGGDGTVYVLCTPVGTAAAGSLVAVTSSGAPKWSVTFPGVSSFGTGGGGSAVSIAEDGTVYVPAAGIVAVDPAGTVKWTSHAASGSAPPAIGGDGTLYASGPGTSFVALNPDGTQKWSVTATGSQGFVGQPVIGGDGTVYAFADDVWAFGK